MADQPRFVGRDGERTLTYDEFTTAMAVGHLDDEPLVVLAPSGARICIGCEMAGPSRCAPHQRQARAAVAQGMFQPFPPVRLQASRTLGDVGRDGDRAVGE